MEDDTLTPEENEIIKRAFMVMDLNGDGRVSQSELVRVCKQMKLNLSYEEAKNILQEVDRNGDGYVDKEEFCSMMKDRLIANRMEENFLREIFESMDCDGNGYISAEEVAKALKLTQEEADDLVREVDEDGDGRISYHEFVDGYRGKNNGRKDN